MIAPWPTIPESEYYATDLTDAIALATSHLQASTRRSRPPWAATRRSRSPLPAAQRCFWQLVPKDFAPKRNVASPELNPIERLFTELKAPFRGEFGEAAFVWL
jgi:hypothetical protein